MNALNLYSIIQQDLDIEEETSKLHEAYLLLINQLDKKTLLDIGCGQGDFLLKVKEYDLDVLGIDLSSEQIKVCKQKNINASCININEITNKYDIATAVFDVLNYVQFNNLKSFLIDIYNVLNENSYFLFDINTLFGFQEVAQGSLNINKESKFIAIDAYFEDNILQTDITLFSKNKNSTYIKEQNNIFQYYHSKEVIEHLLKDTGFLVQNIINLKLHDSNNSDKYLFICKK